ncbi:hypothetical protein NX059_004471 [Plenodomus lindquistii]|nr:hypothetical protein NX059_004471 [Plenodomus lindquistii]
MLYYSPVSHYTFQPTSSASGHHGHHKSGIGILSPCVAVQGANPHSPQLTLPNTKRQAELLPRQGCSLGPVELKPVCPVFLLATSRQARHCGWTYNLLAALDSTPSTTACKTPFRTTNDRFLSQPVTN